MGVLFASTVSGSNKYVPVESSITRSYKNTYKESNDFIVDGRAPIYTRSASANGSGVTISKFGTDGYTVSESGSGYATDYASTALQAIWAVVFTDGPRTITLNGGRTQIGSGSSSNMHSRERTGSIFRYSSKYEYNNFASLNYTTEVNTASVFSYTSSTQISTSSSTTQSTQHTRNKATSTSSTSSYRHTPITTTSSTRNMTYPTVGRTAETITYYTSYEKSKPYNFSFRSTTSVNSTINLKTGISSTTRNVNVTSSTLPTIQHSLFLISSTTSGTEGETENILRDFVHQIITPPDKFSDTRVWYGVKLWYATNIVSSGGFTKCYESISAKSTTITPKFTSDKQPLTPEYYDSGKEPSNTVVTTSTYRISRRPGHGTSTFSWPAQPPTEWDPGSPAGTSINIYAPYTDYTTNELTYGSTTGERYVLGPDGYELIFYPHPYHAYTVSRTTTTAYTITDAVYFKYSKVLRKSKTTSYSYQRSTTSGTKTISTTSSISYPELFTTEAITLPESFTTTFVGTTLDGNVVHLSTYSNAETKTSMAYGWETDQVFKTTLHINEQRLCNYAGSNVYIKQKFASRLDDPNRNQFKVTYKTSPDGFIGFGGSFDSDVKTSKVFRSITTSKRGDPFSGQYEFNIYDYPELFASCRKGGIIIIPEIFTNTFGYTLSAGPAPKDLRTQASFTAFYSSTTNTTAVTETTTRRFFTEYRLTRTRTNTTVQTGQISAAYPYTDSTTTKTTATMYTETSVEYVLGLASPVTGTYFAESAARTRLAEHPCIPAQVTYGTAGDFAGYHDSVISLKPCIFKYTFLNSSTVTSSSSILFTNLTSSMLLTISKDRIMIFEMEPLYSTHTALANDIQLQYSTHKKYTFE